MSAADDSHLVETALRGEAVYDGSFLKVRRDIVRLPNGREASREYVVHPGAVVIIGLIDDDGGDGDGSGLSSSSGLRGSRGVRVLVERQYRYPVGQVITEFPAGKLDPGEDPLVCAQRELLEETGYTAGQWAKAGVLHLAIAYSTEILHVYFARGLKAGPRQLDVDEFLDVALMTPDALLAGARDGQVTDAKTLSCLVWLQNVLSGAWALDWRSV